MFDRNVIGVDLDGRAVSVGKVQNNRIVKEYTAKISHQKSEEFIISEIKNAIDKVEVTKYWSPVINTSLLYTSPSPRDRS